MGVTMMTSFVILLSFFVACANCNYEEKLLECKTKLQDEYQTPSPKDNIWHGLINLKMDKFSGQNPVSAEVEGYYFYLLYILEHEVQLTVISPVEFCDTNTSGNLYPTGRPASEWCKNAFIKLGCSFDDDDGFDCFRNFYIKYLLIELTLDKVFPEWIETVPIRYRRDQSYLNQHKNDFLWHTENIKSYITDYFKGEIMSLDNDSFFDWENYCKDRLTTTGY